MFDNIDPEKTYVSLLKRKIQMKVRVEPKDQKLTIRGEASQVLELTNENSLSVYNLSDSATIILENLSIVAN